MAKTPIAHFTPIVGLGSGEIIQGKPSIVNYTKEVLRNPIDSKDPTTRSAISMLPEEEQFIVDNHVKKNPDLFNLSEKVLSSKMSSLGLTISGTENLLRNKFWLEYDHAISAGYEHIRIPEILRGVCSLKFFRDAFLSNVYMVAYLLLPPVNFKTKQEETLLFSLDRLRDILDLPVIKANGNIDIHVVKAQMGVYQMLERRVQGEVIQKAMHAHAILPIAPSSNEEVNQFSEEQLLLKMQELVDKQRIRATNKAVLSDVFLTEGRSISGSK